MAITDAGTKIEPIVRRYLKALEQAHIRPSEVYLFGSCASERTHRWSDIDIAVVSPDFGGDSLENDMKLMRLTWDVDVRIDPHAFRPEAFSDENPLVAEILRTGVRVI
jgi:predicted nucleotidyltransferase